MSIKKPRFDFAAKSSESVKRQTESAMQCKTFMKLLIETFADWTSRPVTARLKDANPDTFKDVKPQ
jgi:hypothetical protein